MGVAVDNSQLSCMHAELLVFPVMELAYWVSDSWVAETFQI